MKKSNNINIPKVPQGSSGMTTTGIEPGYLSTSYHLQFSGAGGISNYGRSRSSHGDDYDYSIYMAGGQGAASTGEHYHNQYPISSDHAANASTHVGAVPMAYRHAAAALSHHHHHHPHLHQYPHSQQLLLLQQDQSNKGSSSSAHFNMQHVHGAAAGLSEGVVDQRQAYGEVHHMHEPFNYRMAGDGGRATKRKLLVRKQEEEEEDDDDGGDEEEEEEEEEIERPLQEEQSTQQLQMAPASCNNYIVGGSSSYIGELAGSAMGMKKRRLTQEQVRSLEVSFERESKLEAERKNELAMELGLQPRQVAVWFQNRRARFKTKQLERDFDLLKRQYDAVRSEKDNLQAQVARLKDLLDAQMATSKGSTPTTSSEKQGPNDNIGKQHTKPQAENGTIEIKATMEVGRSKQSAMPIRTTQDAEVFSSNNSTPTPVHLLEAPKICSKGPITLEVKPSLQVPHINHPRHPQPHLSTTFSPPTKLSLCTPQQLFLHQMVSMRMEGDNFHPSYHDPYNEEHSHFNCLNENGEEDYRSDSMISSNSAWHHDR